MCVTLASLVLVYACEAPIPTGPQAVKEPVARPEPIPAEQSAAVREDTTVFPIDQWEEARPAVPNTRKLHLEVPAADIIELVRRRYPEVYAHGLPVEQAVWFAIGGDGRIFRSWVGQNLYLNFESYRPLREYFLPAGSAEEARAIAEHRRLERETLDANVPGMRAAGVFAGYYYSPPGNFTVHFITESRGMPPVGWRLSPASEGVAEALRAELQR
jgi:hypothetical protein